MELEYVDLYMFHWPVPSHFIETYKEIEKLYNEGLVKISEYVIATNIILKPY